jgi:hypothetical protein
MLKYILKGRLERFGLDLFGSGWGSMGGFCVQGNKFRGPQETGISRAVQELSLSH